MELFILIAGGLLITGAAIGLFVWCALTCAKHGGYVLALLVLIGLIVSCSKTDAAQRFEVSIVLDHADDKPAADEAMRNAASIFRNQLGIELSTVYSEAAQVADHTNPDALLTALQTFRVNRSQHRDSDATVLFTRRTLTRGYDGIATIGPACAAGAAAVVELHADGLDGQVTAHELLHTVGVPHDHAPGWLMSESLARSGVETLSPDTIQTVKAAPLDCMLAIEPRTATQSGGGEPPTTGGGGGAFDPVSVILLIGLAAFAIIQQYRVRSVVAENKALDHEIRMSIKELHDCVPPDFCLRDITLVTHVENTHTISIRFTTLAGLIEFERWIRNQSQRARRDAQGNPYFTRHTDTPRP